MVNRRTHSVPRRGLRGARSRGETTRGRRLFVAFSARPRPELRPHAYEVFRGLVDIDDFDIAAAVAGAPGPLKCMRRNSIIRARNSRISGRVCPNSNAARAMTGATSAALPRGTFVRSRSPRVASAGAAHAVHGNALLCARAARQSATTTEAAAAQRRSPWSAPEMRAGDANATTRNDRESAMLASNAQIEPPRSTMARRVACRDRAKIRGSMARGCGTGLIHCGGQTGRRFAAEMRYCADSHGKTAARSCGRSSLLQGRLTRRIERPTPRGRSYASYLGGR